MRAFIIALLLCVAHIVPGYAGLFFEDEAQQGGINVFEMSADFADIYEKLNDVKWAGQDINVAIESLESLHKSAHIAATDERVVLVWDDAIIANFPRPADGDWNAFGEITTALILKLRERDARLRAASANEIYQMVVSGLVSGIDENGRYVYSRAAEIAEDNKLLTSVGLEGARDERGNWRVTGVYKGAPADNADIHIDDIVAQINGVDVVKMSDGDLAATMSGFNSGTVKLNLLTPGGARDVVLRRASIVSTDADVIRRDGGDAAGALLEIVIHNVTNNAVSIVAEALNSYDDVSGIVLDLRATTGDDPRAAAKLAGLFIGAVPVMRIQEVAGQEVEVVPGGAAVTSVPVVVLISNTTRGTAEAVAAAFYENSRGLLIGTPTAGGARIATRIDLKNGGALDLLNKSIKTGSGRTIDGRGVFPLVCLSNIRTVQQQNAFFLNVINNDFNARDFNRESDVDVAAIRRGCPVITSGTDEDAVATAVYAKILTDKKLYNRLMSE